MSSEQRPRVGADRQPGRRCVGLRDEALPDQDVEQPPHQRALHTQPEGDEDRAVGDDRDGARDRRVPFTSSAPAPVTAAAMSSGATTIGHVTVIDDAMAAMTTIRDRGTGRSHRYTSVPSSFGSPERGRREHQGGDRREQRQTEVVDEAAAGAADGRRGPTRRWPSPVTIPITPSASRPRTRAR